jgi:small-conductance mechanosensitive channel
MLDLLGSEVMLQILQAAIIVAGAFVFVRIFNRLLLRMAGGRTPEKKRIMRNAQRFLQIVIYSIAAVLLLWTFNVNVTGLLAGLGVGALVIGFALKDFIENWVSGLLIISGKTYKIGDIIQVGNMKGVVTEISLRTTKLKTYDRNEIIIPNSSLLKDSIVNLTGGGKETVASIVFSIDYTFNVEKAKKVIESVLRNHPRVVVDEKRRREIRFLVRNKEWATEIESLFWINDPENEEFIKSQLTETVKTRFEEARILPPIPSIIRKDFLESKK